MPLLVLMFIAFFLGQPLWGLLYLAAYFLIEQGN